MGHDGPPDDGTLPVLEAAAPRFHRLAWTSTGGRRGPAAARNAARTLARAPLLAMTDDDCVPDPGWLRSLKNRLEADPALGAVYGRTVTDRDRLEPFSHYVENLNGEGHQTCNCAVRACLLDRLGGFDERFPFAYLEDTDLYCRIRATAPVAFLGDARVLHPPRPTSFAALVRGVRRFEADFLFAAKHPAVYRSRHQGAGPLREVLWTVGVKHALRRIGQERHWLLRRPGLFLAFTAATLLGSARLWLSAPGWAWKHRRRVSDG